MQNALTNTRNLRRLGRLRGMVNEGQVKEQSTATMAGATWRTENERTRRPRGELGLNTGIGEMRGKQKSRGKRSDRFANHNGAIEDKIARRGQRLLRSSSRGSEPVPRRLIGQGYPSLESATLNSGERACMIASPLIIESVLIAQSRHNP